MNTCFFIGHREAGEELFYALALAVERHISEYGVGEFVVGHYGEYEKPVTSVTGFSLPRRRDCAPSPRSG